MSDKPSAAARALLIERSRLAGAEPILMFVCFGNIVRSRAAEGYARAWLAERGSEMVSVDSAGVSVASGTGEPADDRMAAILGAQGIALDGGSRRVSPDDVSAARLVFAMTADVALTASELMGCPVEDILLFGHFAPRLSGVDVPDPYHQPSLFGEVAEHIREGVNEILHVLHDDKAAPDSI
jgi:protein-tyrosine phosphatase